jgi:hypothetical protein
MQYSDHFGVSGAVLCGIFLSGSTLHCLFGRKSAIAEVLPPFPDLEPRCGPDSAVESFEVALGANCDFGVSIKAFFAELDPDGLAGLRVEVRGESLPVRSPALGSVSDLAAAQWETYDLVRLLVASAYLRSDALDPVTGRNAQRSEDRVSILQTVNVARDRAPIRKAVLAYAAGGAEGLFEAYEALGSEIMNCTVLDYDAGIGTREWLVQQGWITEEEDDRFLKTVQHYRYNDNRSSPFEPFSPHQAQLFVRRVLINLIRYCASVTGQEARTLEG